MTTTLRWVVALTVATVLGGCAALTTVERDGQRATQESLDQGEKQIRNRAAFELKCDSAGLKLKLLNVDYARTASQFGVTGCGKRAVYVRTTSGYSYMWVLDSAGIEDDVGGKVGGGELGSSPPKQR